MSLGGGGFGVVGGNGRWPHANGRVDTEESGSGVQLRVASCQLRVKARLGEVVEHGLHLAGGVGVVGAVGGQEAGLEAGAGFVGAVGF